MSLPEKVRITQSREVSARDIINEAFGGEDNVPSEKSVYVTSSFMTRSYGRKRIGIQMKFSPWRENDYRRAVKSDEHGRLDAEKIRVKYNEVFEYAKNDVEYQKKVTEQRNERRKKKGELRDEVKEVFLDSPIFSPYNDEIFKYDFSFSEGFNSDYIKGQMEVDSDGVNVELEGLSIEESKKLVEFMLKLRENN